MHISVIISLIGQKEKRKEAVSRTLDNLCIMKRKRRFHMAVRLNEDAEVVKTVKDGLKRTGGYCPCRLQRTEENKCICKEFREQIADPNFKGYCHCLLYYKD